MTAQRYVPGRLAEASGLHMNLNGRRSRNSREIEPASALHGLPSECALSVLDLHLDASTDLAEVPLLTVVLVGDEPLRWSNRPVLPPAPSVFLSDQGIAEAEQQTEDAARLDAIDERDTREQSYTEEDLVPLRRAASRQYRKGLIPDALAFYRPFTLLSEAGAVAEMYRPTTNGPQWGIYLTIGGVELLAHEVFARIWLTDAQALRCALAFLLGHELGHFIIDLSLAENDLDEGWGTEESKRVEPLARSHSDRHGGYACGEAEAFCEAYALRFLDTSIALMTDLTLELRTMALEVARVHVADGLPGYRDGASMIGPHALFEGLCALLNHTGVDNPERASLQADLERHTINASDVPVHLVVTPGSALSRGQWVLGRMS
jgi:hypothetical protein